MKQMLKLAVSRLYLKRALSSRSHKPSQLKTIEQLENIASLARLKARKLAKKRQNLTLTQKLRGENRKLVSNIEEAEDLAHTARKFTDAKLWSRWYRDYPSKFHQAGIGSWRL